VESLSVRSHQLYLLILLHRISLEAECLSVESVRISQRLFTDRSKCYESVLGGREKSIRKQHRPEHRKVKSTRGETAFRVAASLHVHLRFFDSFLRFRLTPSELLCVWTCLPVWLMSLCQTEGFPADYSASVARRQTSGASSEPDDRCPATFTSRTYYRWLCERKPCPL
jgi:hypothetical protein